MQIGGSPFGFFVALFEETLSDLWYHKREGRQLGTEEGCSMTEDEKILQEEFQKRWKRSPQKDGCLFSGFIALCLAQTLFAPDFPFRGLNLGDSAFCLGACLVVDVLVGMKRKGIPVNAFGLLLMGYGVVVTVLGFAVTVPGMAFSLPNESFWLKVLLGLSLVIFVLSLIRLCRRWNLD